VGNKPEGKKETPFLSFGFEKSNCEDISKMPSFCESPYSRILLRCGLDIAACRGVPSPP
jgi:hypothetical protein